MAARSHRLLGIALLLTAALLAVTLGGSHAVEVLADKFTLEKLLHRLATVALTVAPLLAVGLLIELLAVGWRRSSLRRLSVATSVSSRVDLVLFAISELRLFRIIGLALFSLAALSGNGVLAERLGIAAYTKVNSPLLGFLVCALLTSFTAYWVHRAQHTPVLWPLHRLHHSAQDMTALTSYRDNVFADLVILPLGALPLSLVTLPDSSLFAFQCVNYVQDLLIHSAWATRWGWLGRIATSPLHHRLHHSSAPADLNRNFSNTSPVWDRLFGTYKEPDDAPVATGVGLPVYDSVGGALGMMVAEVGESASLAVRLARQLLAGGIAAASRALAAAARFLAPPLGDAA